MLGKWEAHYNNLKDPKPYGEDTQYQKIANYLDDGGLLEDWGCGMAYLKKFIKNSVYHGIDGSNSGFNDIKADLSERTSEADNILLRHVLEHNVDWQPILQNALSSFKNKLLIIVFIPFSITDDIVNFIDIWELTGIPAVNISYRNFMDMLEGYDVLIESNANAAVTGEEYWFYVERRKD